jgi:IS5 family transposase
MTNMTGRNETAYLGCVALPDATTLLEFRHLPETIKPGEQVFACVSEALLSSILF